MKIETAKALIAWEDDDDAENYEEHGAAKQVSKSRWTERMSQIYKHKENGSFWRVQYENGLTEYQDLDDDQRNVSVVQVYPHKVTQIVFRTEQQEVLP